MNLNRVFGPPAVAALVSSRGGDGCNSFGVPMPNPKPKATSNFTPAKAPPGAHILTINLLGMMNDLQIPARPGKLLAFLKSKGFELTYPTLKTHIDGTVKEPQPDSVELYAKAFGYPDDSGSILRDNHLAVWRDRRRMSGMKGAVRPTALSDMKNANLASSAVRASKVQLEEAQADLKALWPTRCGALLAYVMKEMLHEAAPDSAKEDAT
jgi:hypothetical protein